VRATRVKHTSHLNLGAGHGRRGPVFYLNPPSDLPLINSKAVAELLFQLPLLTSPAS